jgi:hypothetical protein
MSPPFEPNISAIRVAGVGVLGFVIVAAAMVYAIPAARLLVGGAVICGAVLGAALILVRRRNWKQPTSILRL